MRIIKITEQNHIHAGVGMPPAPIAFGGILLLVGAHFYLTSNDDSTPIDNNSFVTNVSCYVNNWLNLSNKPG